MVTSQVSDLEEALARAMDDGSSLAFQNPAPVDQSSEAVTVSHSKL